MLIYGPEAGSSFYKVFFNEDLYFVHEPLKSGYPLQTVPAAYSAALKEPDPGYRQEVSVNGHTMAETLLLFNYPGKETIPAKDKTFLSQVLTAVRLDLEHIAWANLSGHPQSVSDIIAISHTAVRIIGFGLAESSSDIAPWKVHHQEGRQLLHVSSLQDIAMDKGLKMRLWNGLKEMYGI